MGTALVKPRKPLKRGQPPKRKKPLPRNKKPISRKGRALVRSALPRQQKRIRAKGKPRFKKGRDPQYLEWIRGLPCLCRYVTCEGRIEATHVKSRGAGGADMGNVVPLCHSHHMIQHRLGIQTFAEMFYGEGLDELRRIAAEVYPAQFLRAKELGWPE